MPSGNDSRLRGIWGSDSLRFASCGAACAATCSTKQDLGDLNMHCPKGCAHDAE